VIKSELFYEKLAELGLRKKMVSHKNLTAFISVGVKNNEYIFVPKLNKALEEFKTNNFL
jgi:hypothetical protein